MIDGATVPPQPAPSHLILAQRMLRSRQFAAARSLYETFLARQPDHPEALHGLAISLLNLGEDDRADELLAHAIALAPADARLRATRGNILRKRGEDGAAAVAYAEAVALDPAYVEAHVSLGGALRSLGRVDEAVAALEPAVDRRPDWIGARTALAYALEDAGRNEEAVAQLSAAVDLDPRLAEPILNLGISLLSAERFGDLATAVARAHATPELAAGVKSGMTILQAIALYLRNDVAGCTACVRGARAGLEAGGNFANRQMLRIYDQYVSRLLVWRGHHPDTYAAGGESPLYVVGDSHCLSPAHTRVVRGGAAYRVVPKLVVGGKAWHLANGFRNRWKADFERAMTTIPAGATVIAAFGEIDCRSNEGILPHFRGHPESDLSASIDRLVEDYVAYVAANARRAGHEIMVHGVPAPNVDMRRIAEEDRDLFLSIPRFFNASLSAAAGRHGIGVVDAYAWTAGPDGVSHQRYHLDAYHLVPGFLGAYLGKS